MRRQQACVNGEEKRGLEAPRSHLHCQCAGYVFHGREAGAPFGAAGRGARHSQGRLVEQRAQFGFGAVLQFGDGHELVHCLLPCSRGPGHQSHSVLTQQTIGTGMDRHDWRQKGT